MVFSINFGKVNHQKLRLKVWNLRRWKNGIGS